MQEKNVSRRWCVLAVLAIGLTTTSSIVAEGNTLPKILVQDEAQPSVHDLFTGQLDRIGSEGRQLVIDDTLLDVSPVVELDGLKTSRERLGTKLFEGQTVRFQLSSEKPSAGEIIAIETQ